MSESIPARIERIMRDQNVGFRLALRVAYAESRLEARKAELTRMSKTIPNDIALEALRYGTASTLSMSVFLTFYEKGRVAALEQAEAAAAGEFLEDASDGRAITPDDEAYQHAVADCLAAVRALGTARGSNQP